MSEWILFDQNWRFYQGDIAFMEDRKKGSVYHQSKTERFTSGPASRNFADENSQSEGWKKIDLPHDYIILQKPDEKENRSLGYLKKENAWYRKHFKLEEADRDKRLTLLFEGISTHSVVYLNGSPLKYNFSAFNSFEVDITEMVLFDGEDNVLAVYTSTEDFEGWWYQGGGIYRHVWLRKSALTSVDLWGVFALPRWKSGNEWEIPIESTLRNDSYETKQLRVCTEFVAPNGIVLTSADATAELPARTVQTVSYPAAAIDPLIWDIDDPNLYTVRTTLYDVATGEAVDEQTTRTGFRTFSMDAKNGFVLNGRPVKIQGVCAHQDFGLTGLAVPDNILRYKIQMLKEMGANGYRTSHYMQPNATLDALDEFGFLVMDEARWFDTAEESIRQMETLLRRDRNRPSVILWSTGNEEPTHITDVGRRIHKALAARIRQMDPTRPITSAVSNSPVDATIYNDVDVIGVNYNLETLDPIHEQYPNTPMVSSENCATSTTRGWFQDFSPERGYMPAFDQDTNDYFLARESTWKFFMARDFIMGGYQWDGFEHRGESFWPRLCSQAGAIDLFLQRKDAFYQNQACWTTKPMVHLLPHWNWKGMEGEAIRVSAYTNCDELELFCNGESQGRKQIERFSHGEWSVCYQPGELKVIAYRNGEEVASDVAVTSGPAAKLKLRIDTPAEANDRDLMLLTCYCVDENGVPVPDAAPFVQFSANKRGTIVATGSDVCDHEPVNLPQRQMRAGTITVAVRVHPGEEPLMVYATATLPTGTTTCRLVIEA